MKLKIGDKAPDFTLRSDDGTEITLSKLHGRKVILYFYPKDDTYGCTKEACGFRDQYPAFQGQDALIFGISKDNQASHQKFKAKYSLPFPLLMDENADVCEAYGVVDKKSLFGKSFLGFTRSTFLIDEQGIIKSIWRKVKVSGHAEKVLDEIG